MFYILLATKSAGFRPEGMKNHYFEDFFKILVFICIEQSLVPLIDKTTKLLKPVPSGFQKLCFKNLATFFLSPVLYQKGVFLAGNFLHLTLRYWVGIFFTVHKYANNDFQV
jgi:hypothetical protein